MKKIGFLSFGHWSRSPGSQTRTAADALQQSVELAVAAEELGADGAYFRVHHFARQLASPFPLLAAVGARTSRIEIGTGVIDMRYENPLYMAEDAGGSPGPPNTSTPRPEPGCRCASKDLHRERDATLGAKDQYPQESRGSSAVFTRLRTALSGVELVTAAVGGTRPVRTRPLPSAPLDTVE